MKEKYGDQDEEERAMRLALLGGKEVTGFDIKKHAEKYKFSEAKEPKSDDEEDSDESSDSSDNDEDEGDKQDDTNPNGDLNEEQKQDDPPEIDEDLDMGLLGDQKDDIDPDAIIEENEGDEEEDYNESHDIQ